MSLRFRHLRMRAVTAEGTYGADVPFGSGLTVLWADNTKGKSTCMQGMLYVLGLEKMLSPRREVPLPHAMTSYLNTDDQRRLDVLESWISLEIENSAGQVITVHRAAKASTDPRLITVDFGAALTQDATELRRKDFFVFDGGAAQREDGFHYFLEGFLKWELPLVRRYEGPEAKLYLETVFPLFWVEQKFGWSAIPAAIPTYMRIREVHKRAVEFILDLDVYRLEIQRERLAEKFLANGKDWSSAREELDRFTLRSGGRVVALSEKPVANPDALASGYIEILVGTHRLPLTELASRNRAIAAKLAAAAVPAVEEQSGAVAEKLVATSARVDELNSQKIALHSKRQLKASDIRSLQRRIATLSEDLQKNLDVQKLQRYSGRVATLTPDRCPTCEQALVDTLLSQDALSAVMPIAENIEYIRSQKTMFESILGRETADDLDKSEILSAIDKELSFLHAQIRSLRAELVAPGSSPSAVAIEERLVAEAKVRELDGIQAVFDDVVERLIELQKSYLLLLDEQTKMTKDKLSKEDRLKLKGLTGLLQDQTAEFGFSTFSPADLSVSEDTYRPEKEGYEIGFETSASDAIRLKWAYQLSLLELAKLHQTNHPGLLIFDEPRQQSSSKLSFANLLRRAASSKARNQQVIFSTSEDPEMLSSITKAIDCTEVIFPGYVLQRLD